MSTENSGNFDFCLLRQTAWDFSYNFSTSCPKTAACQPGAFSFFFHLPEALAESFQIRYNYTCLFDKYRAFSPRKGELLILKEQREKIEDFFHETRECHAALAIAALLMAAYLLIRSSRAAVRFVIRYITTPYKRMAGWLCDFAPFSVMELVAAAFFAGALFFLIRGIVRVVRRPGKGIRLYKGAAGFLAAAVLVIDGYCWLWGLNYYGDSFSDLSGLSAGPVAVSDLYAAASYYAGIANSLSDKVARDETGVFAETVDTIFAQSDLVYTGLYEQYPFLDTPIRTPKRMLFSELMSITGFTGVYFPFTSETNLNVNAPACLLPSTVAHELAHQKNIAAEQEANFLAVKACLTCGSDIYGYSGALLGYIHLGNALYDADYTLWETVYFSLNDQVRADLDANNAYWAQYEGKGADAAGKVYEVFLQTQGQSLGMKSYGACVDLLVADYLAGAGS